MPGYEKSRFIDLPGSLSDNFQCGICLAVFNNAVTADCDHTFCKDCLQEYIRLGKKECPKCKANFTRKRANGNDNPVIIEQFVLKLNSNINTMINKLKIKCDFESNGCQTVTALEELSAHLKECEHKICQTCEHSVGNPVTHNCVELLREDRNVLRTKFTEVLDLSIELHETNEKLFKQVQILKHQRNQSLAENENLVKQNLRLKKQNICSSCDLAKPGTSKDSSA